MLDSARIIAAHMGENLPDTLGLDDLECLATERCVLFWDCNPRRYYEP